MEEKIAIAQSVIDRVLDTLPTMFKEHIKNLEFFVEEYPTTSFLEKHGFKNQILLGLYVGVPLNKRGANYNWVLPDRIYIFVEPIYEISIIEGISFQEKVRKVVLHEIGHYFGLSDEDLKNLGVY